ncbi:MAG TPA: pyridoxamine 5'-phosphate oxidase family protein [Nitrososphaera sp.]
MAKLIQAVPSMSKPVTEADVERLLGSKLNLQLATLDEEGHPNVAPVMFYYDRDSGKMYVNADKKSKKVQNIRRNPEKVYYSIDDENLSYEGVKGRARATIIEDTQRNVSILEKINLKYLGTLEHPVAKELAEKTRNGTCGTIEITPKFFSAWNLGKVQ